MGTVPKNGRSATIIDIAREAGVSKTTVSRVLNGSPNVAPQTRSRVLAATQRLSFRVNTAARSLRTNRSAMVGLMVPMLREPFALIAEELDQELAAHNVGLVTTCSRWDPSQDVPKLESLRARGVDAFVISLADDRTPTIAEYLRSIDRPVVLLDRDVRGVSTDAILTDQRPGLTAAVTHLVDLGRTSIGLITLTERTRPGREMFASFREACEEKDCFNPHLIVRADEFDRKAGYESAATLLDQGADALIIGPSSSLTAGVLDRLAAERLRIPEDIALISFDENELASAKHPRLSVISRHIEAIGRYAGELLLARLAQPEAPPRVKIIDTELIINESTQAGRPSLAR